MEDVDIRYRVKNKLLLRFQDVSQNKLEITDLFFDLTQTDNAFKGKGTLLHFACKVGMYDKIVFDTIQKIIKDIQSPAVDPEQRKKLFNYLNEKDELGKTLLELLQSEKSRLETVIKDQNDPHDLATFQSSKMYGREQLLDEKYRTTPDQKNQILASLKELEKAYQELKSPVAEEKKEKMEKGNTIFAFWNSDPQDNAKTSAFNSEKEEAAGNILDNVLNLGLDLVKQVKQAGDAFEETLNEQFNEQKDEEFIAGVGNFFNLFRPKPLEPEKEKTQPIPLNTNNKP